MKKVLLLICCVAGSVLGLAQHKFSIGLGTGLGTYAMEDLRSYESISGDMKVISNYPPYVFWTGKLSMTLENEFRVGLAYGLYSTGYKKAYADYSGLIKAEHIIKGDNVGVVIEKGFWKRNHFSLSADFGLFYGWSELKRQYTIEYYSAPQFNDTSTSKYFSRSISMAPNMAISYRLFERISINGSLGFCYDFRGDLKSNTSGTNYLPKYPHSNEASQSDWTGLRLGLSTTYCF